MMPKKGSRAAPVSGYPSGSLIAYENDGVAIVACVIAYKKDRYLVLNDRGRELELQVIRMHPLPGSMPSDAASTDAKTAYLTALITKAADLVSGISVEEVWSVVASEERTYSVDELCELSFSDNILLHHLAMWLALIHDKVFFKRAKEGFLPRPLSTVDELRRAEAIQKEKQRTRQTALDVFRRLIDKPSPPGQAAPLPLEIRPLVELLEEIAAGAAHIDNTSQKEAKEIVDRADEEFNLKLHGSREQRAFELLCAIGHFSHSTNLTLYRHRLPRDFSSAEIELASSIHVPDDLSAWWEIDKVQSPQPGARVDMTQLECFTIDDASTRDMDDAISLEQTQDGYRIGIHISDVAALVPPASPLDEAARLRATSVYLPELTIHMLPKEISEDKASLVAGVVRPCLSCIAYFDHAYNYQRAEIVPTLIRVSKRFSYDQVDTILDGDEAGPFQTLYAIATSHETARLEGGAMKIYKRDLQITLDQDHNPHIAEFDEHGPARSLVGECMVIANKVMAQYAKEKEFPVVYRQQEAPDKSRAPAPSEPAGDGPAADYSARAVLKKSTTALTPGLHAGLGLDAYLQGTSPIRRYVDLLNQRQILHHLRFGTVCYSSEQLLELLYATDEPLVRANSVTKETRRFWLLRYLELRMHSRPSQREPFTIQGCVLRTDLRHPLVELDEVFLPVLVKTNKPLRVGDIITLRVVAIDPQADHIRLELL